MVVALVGRTPPGVRELKHRLRDGNMADQLVAPLPGCVN